MRRLIIATHSRLAQGFKDALDFLVGPDDRVVALCAYTEDNGESLAGRIEELLAGDDEVVVLTDSLGGSVNQQFRPHASRRVQIVSGVNLPLAMTIALQLDAPELDIAALIEEARQQIVYVNGLACEASDEDE